MIRLTTVATTGRRMNKSVNLMRSLARWRWLHVGRGRVCLVPRLHAVVDLHRDAAAQLEDAGTDHLVARLEAGSNGHLVAAGRAKFHELLLHFLAGLAVRAPFVFDEEDRVAIRRIADGGGRNGDDVLPGQE